MIIALFMIISSPKICAIVVRLNSHCDNKSAIVYY